ncbi:MAG: hypothetical protein ACE14S_08340 [Candidatus Bathyarchaeia archaeon]
MSKDICALCGLQRELRNSHIIPRFVLKWLKASSATGFLRGAAEPEKRKQDLGAEPLLCEECEQIFSKLESYFARNIFYPFVTKGERVLPYDENLMRFIVSLSWRTLKTGYNEQVSHTPWIKEHLDKAEEIWRNFLLRKFPSSGQYEHHMFFLDYVEKGEWLSSYFQWYILRATDSTLASNESDTVFVYTHFPAVMFVSTIYPLELSGWIGTKIAKRGKTALKFTINDGRFGDFLKSRVELIRTPSGDGNSIKDNQILKSLSKDPERFLNSESFKVMLAESKLRRHEKMKDLPPRITGLIDVIERSLDNPSLNSLEQKRTQYVQDLIANELSSLSRREATEIDRRIYTALSASLITRQGICCTFETAHVLGKFAVCFAKTKDEQRELANAALDQMIRSGTSSDKDFLIVVSFNPDDPVLPFETLYYIK